MDWVTQDWLSPTPTPTQKVQMFPRALHKGTMRTFTAYSLVRRKRDHVNCIQGSWALTAEHRGDCRWHPGTLPTRSPPGLGTLCPWLLGAHCSCSEMCPLRQTTDPCFQVWERKATCLSSSHCPHHLERRPQRVLLGPGLLTPTPELTAPRDSRKEPGCQASHSWAVLQEGA